MPSSQRVKLASDLIGGSHSLRSRSVEPAAMTGPVIDDDETSPIVGLPGKNAALPVSHPLIKRVFRPFTLLLFFTMCNFVNYFDRGVIGGVLVEIEAEYHLNHTMSGLVGSSFMIGFMIFSPIFAHLSHTYRPTSLMTIGLLIWVLAAILAGLSVEFYTLGIARMLIGVGEASFAGLAPTYIDDIAPNKSRTTWLALFYSAIPVGAAFGYSASGIVSTLWTWRLIFIIESLIMVPFVGLCFLLPDSREVVAADPTPTREVGSDGTEQERRLSNGSTTPVARDPPVPTFMQSVRVVFSIPVYNFTVLGYGALTFVIGALSFWSPNYMTNELGLELQEANLGIGGVTVVTGLLGTAFGGYLIDRLGGSQGKQGIVRAMRICMWFSVICLPLAVAAFAVDSIWFFFILIGGGEFIMFATTAPLTGAMLSMVPNNQRSFAMALCIFMIHLLGDFPSPILVGLVSDFTDSQRVGMLFLSSWITFAVIFFACAYVVARRAEKDPVEKEEPRVEWKSFDE
eukprot:TRINITY_DN4720_c0_g2_i1.p1 TRINITY_DN4720_c0_g2~~TRINITY_DN4720_c0_g2_i1.p1  ORF type:complete len:513 (+),score=101.48 TRINITY_DN4720_c0_g2_i1:317-1855(+)